MVIIVINGGFANQLYRYACAYATFKKYKQELVIIAYTGDCGTDPFQLSEFQLEYSELYIAKSIVQANELLEKWKKCYNLREVKEEEFFSVISDDIFRQYEGIILYGAYQKQSFFGEYINDLREIFQFKKETFFLQKFKEELRDKQSVGVHVRRGDFLTYDNLQQGMEFYKAAMCVMEDKLGYGEAEYYIFSDDKDFVRSYFGRNRRIHYVQVYGDYREAVEEFLALSLCSHRILAIASSYSRMADALNTNPSGYAIYEQNGLDEFVFSRENLFFLDREMVIALEGYYAPIFDRDVVQEAGFPETEVLHLDSELFFKLSMDTRDITKESEIAFRIRKIEYLICEGEYAEALGQTRKLWELADGTKFQDKMHELYWKCLYGYGRRTESLIEAVFLTNVQVESHRWYNQEEQNLLKDLSSTGKDVNIVFIPSRRFAPNLFEDIIQIGGMLKRLGYKVTFMFWEPEPGSERYQPYKKVLQNSSCFEDIRGHNSQCMMIDLTEKENLYGGLKSFFDNYFVKSEKTILFTKQKKVLCAIDKCLLRKKITSIYWDYSNRYDLGNFEGVSTNMGVKVFGQEISQKDILECYQRADYTVTFDEYIQTGKPIVRLRGLQEISGQGQERNIVDYCQTDRLVIENTFSIVKKIIKPVCMEEDKE